MSNGCKEERHFALTNSIELNFSFNVYLTFLFSTTTTTMVKANSAKGRSLQQQGFTESMSKTERECVKERETEKECAIEGEGKEASSTVSSVNSHTCVHIHMCMCVSVCMSAMC